MFPNIVKMLSIKITKPATSASAERANSALCYVKTDFWSAMSVDSGSVTTAICSQGH